MIPRIKYVIGFFLLSLILSAQDMSAEAMMQKVEAILAPDMYFMQVSIETIEANGTSRVLSLDIHFKRSVGTYMEMTAPARQRGIRFLQRDDALWLYNPRSHSSNPVRLSPRENFQGSVFSNSDISDPQYSENYTISYGESQEYEHKEIGFVQVYTLVAEAKHDQAPYGRIRMLVEANELLPLRIDYYARSGLHFKQMTLSGIKTLAGQRRPSVMSMESFELQGIHSVVRIETLSLEEIPESRLHRSNLTR